MREIKVKIFSNKKISSLNGQITCHYGENKIDKIVFDIDEDLLQFNNFLILKSPTGTTYVDIVIDKEYVIGSFITNVVGNWTMQFLSSEQEDIVDEDEIDDTKTIMLSDKLTFVVENSLANGTLVIPPTSAELDLWAERLETLYNQLQTLITDYPQVVNYIDIQSELAIIEDMIENINMEVTVDNTEVLNAIDHLEELIQGITVSVDLTPVLNAIADVKTLIQAIPTNDYTTTLTSIINDLTSIKSDLASVSGDTTSIGTKVNNALTMLGQLMSLCGTMNGNINTCNTNINTLSSDVADMKNRSNETSIAHDAYWALIRAEQANTNTATIITLLSDTANVIEDIENGGV